VRAHCKATVRFAASAVAAEGRLSDSGLGEARFARLRTPVPGGGPDASYFWLPCGTAAANSVGRRALPLITRQLVGTYACPLEQAGLPNPTGARNRRHSLPELTRS
jgi:hypothetical protein